MIFHDTTLLGEPPLPVGTSYTITSSGSWTCPATGQWQVELHGGGGGGGGANTYNTPWGVGYYHGGGGGGSGLLQTVRIRANYPCSIVIGLGGAGAVNHTFPGANGGSTSIIYAASTQLICPGGFGGEAGTVVGGAASGNIASAGDGEIGGYGNANKPEQTYGNGGNGGTIRAGNDGQPGAAILTYLGK